MASFDMEALSGSGRKRVALNGLWNVIGQASPLIVAIAALPLIIKNIGLERYGLLTLIWVLIGYAGIFDLGVGRALTRLIAQRLGANKSEEARQLARAGLSLLLGCGLIVAGSFALLTPILTNKVLHVSAALASEAESSLMLVAVSLPFVMLTSGYTGIMAAYQKFKPLNLIKLCMGFLTYGGPALLSFYVPNLDAAVALLLALRIMSTVVHAVVSRRCCGLPYGWIRPQSFHTRELLGLGGWITVSNVVSPLLSYMDRFVVATLVPVSFIAYYATSFDLLSRSMLLPYALMTAAFPVASHVRPGSPEASRLMSEMARALLVLMFPLTFCIFVLAEPGLKLWLGPEFAAHGAPVLKILAVGVLMNTLAQAPATLIQAAGQPRWMAITHVCELPIFIAVLWALTSRYGIVGTAIAAALRNGVDALIVTFLATRGLLKTRFDLAIFGHACLLGLLFGGALLVDGPAAVFAYLVFGLAAFVFYVGRQLMSATDRQRFSAWRLRLLGHTI